jgi:hypothetical protein
MCVRPSWRVFLYDSVLLPFETGTLKTKVGNYDSKAVESSIGLKANRIDKLADLQPLETQYKDVAEEFLDFYNPEKDMKSLFERLRDVVAHGHCGLEKYELDKDSSPLCLSRQARSNANVWVFEISDPQGISSVH